MKAANRSVPGLFSWMLCTRQDWVCVMCLPVWCPCPCMCFMPVCMNNCVCNCTYVWEHESTLMCICVSTAVLRCFWVLCTMGVCALWEVKRCSWPWSPRAPGDHRPWSYHRVDWSTCPPSLMKRAVLCDTWAPHLVVFSCIISSSAGSTLPDACGNSGPAWMCWVSMGGACLGPYQVILQSLLDTACLQTRWWVEEQATWVRQSACPS